VPSGSSSRVRPNWRAEIAVELRNVDTLAPPPGDSHVAVGSGGAVVFTAGAVPLDAQGDLVGGDDPVAPAEQVIENLLAALETGGAQPRGVAKTTVCVAGASYEAQSAVWQVVRSSEIGRAPARWLASRPSGTAVSWSRSRRSP
jgi:enamine deaminase RidA (YjgF/YER057c/UK114 family)